MKRFVLIISVLFFSMNAFAQYGGYNGGYLGYFNTDAVFNALMQQTMAQYQAQQASMNEVYNQLMQQAANAAIAQCQSGIQNYSTYQGSSLRAAESSTSSYSTYENCAPKQICSSCVGSGKCKYCNGDGYARTGGMGLQTRDMSAKCPHCYGTGICPICHGK